MLRSDQSTAFLNKTDLLWITRILLTVLILYFSLIENSKYLTLILLFTVFYEIVVYSIIIHRKITKILNELFFDLFLVILILCLTKFFYNIFLDQQILIGLILFLLINSLVLKYIKLKGQKNNFILSKIAYISGLLLIVISFGVEFNYIYFLIWSTFTIIALFEYIVSCVISTPKESDKSIIDLISKS